MTPPLSQRGKASTPDYDPDGGMVGPEAYTRACVNGRWVPAIPLKAPVDVRWCCEHVWTPHVYPQGWDAWNYFDCTRCGAECEAANLPEPGAWPIRRWLAERLFPYGRTVRRSR